MFIFLNLFSCIRLTKLGKYSWMSAIFCSHLNRIIQYGHCIFVYFSTMNVKVDKIVLLLLIFTYASSHHKDMRTFVQKCTSKCNEKYCNITSVCRPLNRTSKILSLDVYFHPNVILEAPLYVNYEGMHYILVITLMRKENCR